MQKLLQDIKNHQFNQIYLLYGEEAYLRKQYRDRMKEALAGDGDTMNCHYYEGKSAAIEEIIDLAETLPFFAERRVIIIENSGWFEKGGDKLADYLEEIPATTFFLFVETKLDKRCRLYKTVKKIGRLAEFSIQDEATLKKWVLGILKKENKNISSSNLNFLLERTGTDMAHIKMETEKLLCYCMDKEEITAEDIERICVKRVQNQIFEMINAIAMKEQKKALDLYYDLLTLKEPPMKILALIGRQFNLLLQVKELKKKGYSTSVISEKTGLHSFVAGKYERQSAKFKYSELKKALEDCVQADERIKMGKMQDVMSVELFIVEYSR